MRAILTLFPSAPQCLAHLHRNNFFLHPNPEGLHHNRACASPPSPGPAVLTGPRPLRSRPSAPLRARSAESFRARSFAMSEKRCFHVGRARAREGGSPVGISTGTGRWGTALQVSKRRSGRLEPPEGPPPASWPCPGGVGPREPRRPEKAGDPRDRGAGVGGGHPSTASATVRTSDVFGLDMGMGRRGAAAVTMEGRSRT